MLQIIFAVVGSVTSISMAFTVHIGGFIAGLSFTKVFANVDSKKKDIGVAVVLIMISFVVTWKDDRIKIS